MATGAVALQARDDAAIEEEFLLEIGRGRVLSQFLQQELVIAASHAGDVASHGGDGSPEPARVFLVAASALLSGEIPPERERKLRFLRGRVFRGDAILHAALNRDGPLHVERVRLSKTVSPRRRSFGFH